MALRPRHAALAVFAGAALIAVALLPPAPDPRWARVGFDRRPRTRVDQLNAAVSTVARRVEALELRDALRTRLRRSPVPPGSPPALWLDPSLPLAVAGAIHPAWDTVVARLGPLHARSALVLAVRPDTAPRWPGRTWYFLPRATDGHTCVVAAMIATTGSDLRSAAPVTQLLSLLGPCAYYASFGPAGPAIERWLAERATRTANAPQWLEQAPRRREQLDDLALIRATDGLRAGTLIDRLFDVRYRGDVNETACAAGRPAACRRFLNSAEALRPSPGTGLRPAGILDRSLGLTPSSFAPWRYHPEEVNYFLSDLVRDEGPERFGRFWRSADPVDTAFRAVYGRSLEDYTTAWLRAGRDVRAGPSIRWTSVAVSLMVAFIVGGLTVAWTTRRQTP